MAIVELPQSRILGPDEVFTRPWVVDLILDLIGYTATADLARLQAIEPSCGAGAFVRAMVSRLFESLRLHGHAPDSTADSLRAFDIRPENTATCRSLVVADLVESGYDSSLAIELTEGWITTADFLIDCPQIEADFVIGNPPYKRIENIDPNLQLKYRERLPTMRGRSDIYVGFINQGLNLLGEGGKLGYICPDRWMRNQYGTTLRSLVGDQYSVEAVVSLSSNVQPFAEPVDAYPSLIFLKNSPQGCVVAAEIHSGFDGNSELSKLVSFCSESSIELRTSSISADRLPKWYAGGNGWHAGLRSDLDLIETLSTRFASLGSDAKTRVGVGAATGCDDIFLVADPHLVEPERTLQIARSPIRPPAVTGQGPLHLVNPWQDGALVELADWPKLSRYLHENQQRLQNRYIVRQQSAPWYRTIDKVNPALVGKPKLLIQDVGAELSPVLDVHRYPHNSLYWITSESWDLEVLGGLLCSDVVEYMIRVTGIGIRGGYQRYQAQYLRQLRLPPPDSLTREQTLVLAEAFRSTDRIAATEVAAEIFQLTRGSIAQINSRISQR